MTKISKFILFFFVSLCLACLIASQVNAATVVNISNSGIQSQDGNTAKGWYGSSRDTMGFNYRYNLGSWTGNNLGFYFDSVTIPKGKYYTTISVQYKANTGSQIYANTTSMILANGFNNTNAICELNPSFTDSGNGLVYYYNVICDIPSSITINNYRFSSSTINGLSIYKNGIVSNDTDEIFAYLSTINSSILGQNNAINNINTNIQNQSTQQHNDIINLNNNITSDNITGNNSSDSISSISNTFSSSNDFILNLFTLPYNFITTIMNGVSNSCTPISLGTIFDYELIMPCINLNNWLGNVWTTIVDVVLAGMLSFAFRKRIHDFFFAIIRLDRNAANIGGVEIL